MVEFLQIREQLRELLLIRQFLIIFRDVAKEALKQVAGYFVRIRSLVLILVASVVGCLLLETDRADTILWERCWWGVLGNLPHKRTCQPLCLDLEMLEHCALVLLRYCTVFNNLEHIRACVDHLYVLIEVFVQLVCIARGT